MRSARTPRGITLIELVVAMAVSAVVLAGVVTVVGTQQKAYYDGHRQRAAQAGGRAALLFMEQALMLAGYGLDAPLAFDFDRYAGPCPPELAPCLRDSVSNSDEIVFYNRNPRYGVTNDAAVPPVGNAWQLISASPVDFTLNAREGDVFPRGQIIQVVCDTGRLYAYGTVLDTVVVPDDAIPPRNFVPTAIALTPPVMDDPFQRPDEAVDGCFFDGTALAFLVERHRFHVRPVREGTVLHPYLAHDRGVDVNLDNVVDELDEELLAEGIEVLQLGYVMTSNTLAARGTSPGVAIGMARGSPGALVGDGMTLLDFPGVFEPPSLYRSTSFYPFVINPPPHPRRLTDHQANIRAVRIALLARSPEPDPTAVGGGGIALPVLNMNTRPPWINDTDRHARVRFDTTVLVRNMAVRAMTDF